MKTRVVELMARVKGDPSLVGKIGGSSHLVDDVGLDSLQMINLILLIENEFGIEIDFDSFQVDHLSSLDRFTEYLQGLARA